MAKMARKRPAHRSVFEKSTDKLNKEGDRQNQLLLSSTAIAFYRYWGWDKYKINDLMYTIDEVWTECADDIERSMVEMCEQETGIELQNGDGKSWHDLHFLNSQLDPGRMTGAQRCTSGRIGTDGNNVMTSRMKRRKRMAEYVSKTDVLNLPQSIERNLCGEIVERSIDVQDIESLEPADVAPYSIEPDGTLTVTVPKGTKRIGRILIEEDGTQYGGLFYPDTGGCFLSSMERSEQDGQKDNHRCIKALCE